MRSIRAISVAAAGIALLTVAAGPVLAASPEPEKFVAGRSLEGRPIECYVYGRGDDVLWIIATIHGNEAAGTPLVEEFMKWLEEHPEELEGRQVVIMPVANPDGMAENVRHNMNGVDLNRNFPSENFDGEVKVHGPTPLSEPESRALMRVLAQFFPDRAVTIHQPLDCMDWDGPRSKAMAEAMAAHCRLKVDQVGSRPGSLGSFFGLSLGKPIVTMELPGDAGMDPEVLWKEYGESLIAALRYEAPESGAKQRRGFFFNAEAPRKTKGKNQEANDSMSFDKPR